MDVNVLREIANYKLPRLRQAGYEIDNNLRMLLFSRGGCGAAIERAAGESERATGRDRRRPVEIAEIG
jgi:hypothetical protein